MSYAGSVGIDDGQDGAEADVSAQSVMNDLESMCALEILC